MSSDFRKWAWEHIRSSDAWSHVKNPIITTSGGLPFPNAESISSICKEQGRNVCYRREPNPNPPSVARMPIFGVKQCEVRQPSSNRPHMRQVCPSVLAYYVRNIDNIKELKSDPNHSISGMRGSCHVIHELGVVVCKRVRLRGLRVAEVKMGRE